MHAHDGFLWGRATVVLVLIAATLALPTAATAARVHVESQRQFDRALARMGDRGGIIVLAPGRYPRLVVGHRSIRARGLTIRARRGARTSYLGLDGSRRVRVVGLTITPAVRNAFASLRGSRQIRLEGLRLTAAGRSGIARMRFQGARDVLVRGSDFSHCGDGTSCVLTGSSSNVRFLSNAFHDCLGCDFVRGRVGAGLLVRGNRFDRAVPGPCGIAWACNHQDLLQLQGGSGIVIERNYFGLMQVGAGQVYLKGAMTDVAIRDNVFLRTDPAYPDYSAWTGIVLGNPVADHVPTRVVIANNTIRSGSPRTNGVTNSVILSPVYATLPPEERPVLANNVLGVTLNPELLCPFLQASLRNVVEAGEACGELDVVGGSTFDDAGKPTSESLLTIDQGDVAWATPFDILGVPRGQTPDIGAYEHVG